MVDMEREKWKHDTEYISYIESGESAAVFIVRDIVNSIDTRGKWIDVISLNTYYKSGADGRKAFNWIIVELFPRNIKPHYDKKDPLHNKYLTWKAANEDISIQRAKGYNGPKYLVLCDLFNKNKKKYRYRTITARMYWEPVEAHRPMKIREQVEPEREYRIRAVTKVNIKQVDYIRRYEYELEDKIRENGRPSLEILGLQERRKNK